MNDYLNEGTWQELLLKRFKHTENLAKKIKKIIDGVVEDIEEITDSRLDDVVDYIETMNKQVHIPMWNRLSDVTPDSLKICTASGYIVSWIDAMDLMVKAQWDSKNKCFITYDEELEKWTKDESVEYWIPLIFPETF